MITTIGSANIHCLICIHYKEKKKGKKCFLLVMRTLRTYSLNKFPMCHKAVLPLVIMLYIIPLVLIYLTTGSLSPFLFVNF